MLDSGNLVNERNTELKHYRTALENGLAAGNEETKDTDASKVVKYDQDIKDAFKVLSLLIEPERSLHKAALNQMYRHFIDCLDLALPDKKG